MALHGVLLLYVVSQTILALGATCPRSEWVDPDTPGEACVGKTDSMGAPLELVFSDEFNVDGRTFQDGDDPRWTAVTGFPQSNSQVNAYVDSPSHASTRDGKLRLRADSSNNNMEYFGNHWGLWNYTANAKKSYATPMLQTWNKFCFTEGVLEMSAQLPGVSTQGGLWPAFWIMGNLGRATAQKSTDKIWPFSYSHCPSGKDRAANQDPSAQQEINACRDEKWTAKYGLNPRQGRGAIEIDIVEAMPGNFSFSYKEWKVDSKPNNPAQCPALPEDQYALVESPRPMVATSLQLAPGLPFGSDQRPLETNTKHGGSQRYNCLPSDWNRQWYPELKQGNVSTYGTTYKSQPNVDFWGEYFKGSEIDLQTDSMSSLNVLPHEAYTGQHIYQLDWKAGPDGHVEFNMDGKRQFRVNASTALREHVVTKNNWQDVIGNMLGRQMPEEPSYIMLNIDLSTRWGWPDCNREHCECCSDCRDPKCTTCEYPWAKGVNQRQWLANLCKTLPAYYKIDYVRLWQRQGNTRTSCSPKDYPTQGWIESHRDRYILPNMNEPLRPVLAGGKQCGSDVDCGGADRGSCNDGTCQCSKDWTGPRCLVRRSGASLTCKALEDAAVGGAPCDTSSPTDCGRVRGRGICVEAARPGGQYAPNQTYQTEDGIWKKAGGGDGRCLCNAGWAGVACTAPQPAGRCVPALFPNPAWMGETLEEFVEKACNLSDTAAQESLWSGFPNNQSKHTAALTRACNDVLWKPHWAPGGAYAGCGAWLRASWVATVASCGILDEQISSETSVLLWVLALVGGVGALLLSGACVTAMCRGGCRCMRSMVALTQDQAGMNATSGKMEV